MVVISNRAGHSVRQRIMRTTIFILTIIFLFNCSDKKTDSKKLLLFYLQTSDRSRDLDTIKYVDFNSIDTADKFIGSGNFIYNKQGHVIKAFTSDNHAPVDGGRLYYTMDTLGIIYSRSTTWYNSVRLQSNDDSVNSLINHAFGNILLNPKLHCYNCPPALTTVTLFTPPVVKE
jgi:hypothetical protein